MSRNKVVGIIALIVVVLGIGFLLMSNKNSAPEVKEPITIGALYPLTGGLANYGEAAQKSAALALEEINKNGGVNGHLLVIDFEDHKCDPKTALSIFTEQKDVKHIKVFTSAACSGTIFTLAPQLTDSVLLGAAISADKITGVSPSVFRNWTSDGLASKLFVGEIKKNEYKSVGVIYEQTDYAKGLKDGLEKFLLGTDVKVVSEGFASDAGDVRTQLTKLAAQNPDVWFLSAQTVVNGDKILKEMKELNIKPKVLFVNDNILKSKDLLAQYGEQLEGAFGGDYIVEKTAKLESMLKNFQAKYGTECKNENICATVYDNIYLLKDAIEKNGDDASKVKDYLKSVKYSGVSGEISFDEKNDRVGAGYSLFVVKDGKITAK